MCGGSSIITRLTAASTASRSTNSCICKPSAMARIVGGIGSSHTPTIGFALDANKQTDPVWAPIFAGFEPVQRWLQDKRPDVLFFIYNDHVTSFFFDHYSHFALGVGEEYAVADEGGGPRNLPPVKGHPALARHIATALTADEFRSEEHTSELQSQSNLVCRLLLEKTTTNDSGTSTPAPSRSNPGRQVNTKAPTASWWLTNRARGEPPHSMSLTTAPRTSPSAIITD